MVSSDGSKSPHLFNDNRDWSGPEYSPFKQLKHCLQPNLKNVDIDWGPPLDVNNSCQAPSGIPSLYNGSRIQVFRLLDKMAEVPSKIKITAEIPTENESYEEEISVDVSSLKGDLLHKMFARKMIQELEEREEIEDKKEVKELVTELSLKYQIMSKQTSIVAVDTKENSQVWQCSQEVFIIKFLVAFMDLDLEALLVEVHLDLHHKCNSYAIQLPLLDLKSMKV